ncbi:helix-turn-helix domain-containing protein [Pedobacter sp. HMF7647]|uniref:Helix-turn-helix domain-containing protein n=1 Tax=Hufsiella arboris TaxID=2695275 RepID=A0A7K1Y4Q0_9SPHI|nr:helix-turn-helix transcriptional regulator [Hufsiella arboris]MXV49556.1 helix-turn-helix domain-containing protein [Hufsiella arboris]
MEKHYGQLVEYRIRKNGYSITDLAKTMGVNRRSIYNWFNQRYLKTDIIYRIGCAIRHDFSQDFPEFFVSEDFSSMNKPYQGFFCSDLQASENWKTKYITLLEKYNELLVRGKQVATFA